MGGSTVQVAGDCVEAFRGVRNAFQRAMELDNEVGAALAVYVEGERVVNLWAGDAEKDTRAWDADTLCPVFSVSKGIAATVALMLADRGLLDVNAPVARYWPEFGQNGKEEVRVSHVLTHTAGLPWFDRYWDVVSFDSEEGWGRSSEITAALASSPTLWEPGTQIGYHSFTYGWLLGEICRRVTGSSIGAFLRQELCGPLGADFHIGLPVGHEQRLCRLYAEGALAEHGSGDLGDADKAFFVGPRRRPHIDMGNSTGFLRAEVPAASGVGTADSVARIYSLLACAGRAGDRQLVSADAVREHTREWVQGKDVIFGFWTRVGLGYGISSPGTRIWFGPESASFGFTGMGGNTGFADPVRRLSVGFVVNHWRTGGLVADPRWSPIFESLYHCV